MSPKTMKALAKLFDLPERTRWCSIEISFEEQTVWVKCEHCPALKTDENGELPWVEDTFKLVDGR